MEYRSILIIDSVSHLDNDFIRLVSEIPVVLTEIGNNKRNVGLYFGRFFADETAVFYLFGKTGSTQIHMGLATYVEVMDKYIQAGVIFFAHLEERSKQELIWCRNYLPDLPYVLAVVDDRAESIDDVRAFFSEPKETPILHFDPQDAKTAQAIVIRLLEQSADGRAVLKKWHVF